MKGIIDIHLHTAFIDFKFSLERQVTVFSDLTSTYKSYFYDLVHEHARKGEGSGVFVEVTGNYAIRSCPEDWELVLPTLRDTIIVIDEDDEFVVSKAFADVVKKSTNRFIIINREALRNIPYSMFNIYTLHASGKYIISRQKYSKAVLDGNPDCWITEDEGKGNRYISDVLNHVCIPAGGNSKVKDAALSCTGYIGAVIDAAAFGPYIEEFVYNIQTHRLRVFIGTPESFEWLLLHADKFKKMPLVQKALTNTAEEFDSAEYFSWEQYFTHILKLAFNELYSSYIKDGGEDIPKFFYSDANKDTMYKLITGTNRIKGTYTEDMLQSDTELIYAILAKGVSDAISWFSKEFPNGAVSRAAVFDRLKGGY